MHLQTGLKITSWLLQWTDWQEQETHQETEIAKRHNVHNLIGDMPDNPDSPVWVWPPPSCLFGLEELHSHTPVMEICSEGVNRVMTGDPLGRSSWFLVGEGDCSMQVSCRMAIMVQKISEKLNPLSRVHARHRRQTDDRRICHAISQTYVVSHHSPP